MKKIEEEVVVDENLHLLNEKHKDIVIRKNSYPSSNGFYKGGRRATEPYNISQNGKEKSQDIIDKKSQSYKELHPGIVTKSIENGVNGEKIL